MKKPIIYPTVTLLVLTICSSILFMANATTFNESVYLDESEEKTLTINLDVNQNITGSFTIAGEVLHFWEDFSFKVIDPKGVVFVDEEPFYIDWKYNFTFKALTAGEHSLIFKNGNEAARYVDLSYDIESETFLNFFNQDNVLLWIIIIVLSIGLVLMGLGVAFLLRRNKK